MERSKILMSLYYLIVENIISLSLIRAPWGNLEIYIRKPVSAH